MTSLTVGYFLAVCLLSISLVHIFATPCLDCNKKYPVNPLDEPNAASCEEFNKLAECLDKHDPSRTDPLCKQYFDNCNQYVAKCPALTRVTEKLPASSSQPPGGSQQPSGGSEQPPSGSEQPSSGSEQSPSGSQQPSGGSEQPPSVSEQPSSGSEQPPSGSQQPPSGSQQPAGSQTTGPTNKSNSLEAAFAIIISVIFVTFLTM